jgi:hypothetical protein
MMSEEFQLTPPEKSKAFNSAMHRWVLRPGGIAHPALPVLFLDRAPEHLLSIVIAALTLFIVGVYKARVTVGKPFRSGCRWPSSARSARWRAMWWD